MNTFIIDKCVGLLDTKRNYFGQLDIDNINKKLI